MGKKYIRYLYDKNMYPEFSQRLKEARKNKKLSQQNVADQIGCSRTLYQQMENGGASAIQHAHELGNVFGKEIFDVFPYDIYRYSNEFILVCMAVFNKDYKEIANTLGCKEAVLKKSLLSEKTIFYLHLKDQIDIIFPDMGIIDSFSRKGRNSVVVKIKGSCFVYMNVMGSMTDSDKVSEIMEEKMQFRLQDGQERK